MSDSDVLCPFGIDRAALKLHLRLQSGHGLPQCPEIVQIPDSCTKRGLNNHDESHLALVTPTTVIDFMPSTSRSRATAGVTFSARASPLMSSRVAWLQ
jgi:hypothetical protein